MKTLVRVADVVAVLDRLAPPALAFAGDRIGLQVGRMDKPVQRVWLALDPYPQVIGEAVRHQVDLLITHHAQIFRPLTQVNTATARGAALAEALAHGLTVYNAHTNLDVAAGGVNDVLAELFGLRAVQVLHETGRERLYKLVVYVPADHRMAVLDAVCAAGAGHLGNYSHCTFSTAGEGTFLPEAGAHPYLGAVGRLEQVAEQRLETVVPESRFNEVVAAMRAVHPYEEVAYDVYALELPGPSYGLGRVGELPEPMPLAAWAERVRQVLGLAGLRYAGPAEKSIRRVAVVGGSGGRYTADALRHGADVLLTADCDHHTVAEAVQDGLAVVDATHAALERPVLRKVQAELQAAFPNLEITVAEVPEDPFVWLSGDSAR
ncbi:MAG: Nif3-like dinuclear metal center hexameric protein [Alicyclobacillus sp.]|nr:Nif3-like dinuclear metal center hexameric protein [Alicyclobacillus sp.]